MITQGLTYSNGDPCMEGDIVEANEFANDHYLITKEGIKCKVISIESRYGSIEVAVIPWRNRKTLFDLGRWIEWVPPKLTHSVNPSYFCLIKRT